MEKIQEKARSAVDWVKKEIFQDFESEKQKKQFNYTYAGIFAIVAIVAVSNVVSDVTDPQSERLLSKVGRGHVEKAPRGDGKCVYNWKLGLDDWDNCGKLIWGTALKKPEWVLEVQMKWNNDFLESQIGAEKMEAFARIDIEADFEGDEANCEEITLSQAYEYPWDVVPQWGEVMSKWWESGLIRANGKPGGNEAGSNVPVNRMWKVLYDHPSTPKDYEFNRFICVMHREVPKWFRYETHTHPHDHDIFTKPVLSPEPVLEVVEELRKFWVWMEEIKKNDINQHWQIIHSCRQYDPEFRNRKTSSQYPTMFRNLDMMKDPYLKLRAYEFYMRQDKNMWHRFNLFEAAFRQIMQSFAGDRSHTFIFLNVLDIFTCAAHTAEYPERLDLDVKVSQYLVSMMKEKSIGWYLFKKMPYHIMDFGEFINVINPSEPVVGRPKYRLNGRGANLTSNFGEFYDDSKKNDGTYDWHDPIDDVPDNTIISSDTHVHLSGWAYKHLEFPLLDKPAEFFHRILKIPKKYYFPLYKAFDDIANVVGYTLYDKLWMSIEQNRSSKNETEQMAILNRQQFLEDTQDCTTHGATFASWAEYKTWAHKQLKLQIMSQMPAVKANGYTEANCRVGRWLKWATNPYNYMNLGFDIDSGVIMANMHHEFTDVVKIAWFAFHRSHINLIRSFGMSAWNLMMTFINLLLLRMGLVYLRSTPGKVFALIDNRKKHRARIEQAKQEREEHKKANKLVAVDEYLEKHPECRDKYEKMQNLSEEEKTEVISKLRKRLLLNNDNSDYIYESNYFDLAHARTPAQSKQVSELMDHNTHHFRKSKIPTKHNGGAPFMVQFERYQDYIITAIIYFYVIPWTSDWFFQLNGMYRGRDYINSEWNK